ncbi:Uncharacterized protein DBV15_06731 [Temnothorax longispinosus]|uniref:Uncharacterized protein n=1 Tax=Temnothorax longispinosus TaxID=300112 RepID=A0A4S2JWB3_9HYME|nr:Uncharacterized protein DBV15_06731 [Temnothorax longispinosus]
MDYGFGGALVLHVGRQRGDKNPVSQCIAVVVATTAVAAAAAAATAAAVTGGVVRQAGGASGWQRVGVWLVPSFVRSGGREGRSDDPETEGAQSAVSRAETVTVTSVADVVITKTVLCNFITFIRISKGPSHRIFRENIIRNISQRCRREIHQEMHNKQTWLLAAITPRCAVQSHRMCFAQESTAAAIISMKNACSEPERPPRPGNVPKRRGGDSKVDGRNNG